VSGYVAFLKKEARETLRTWRLWVLPGILVFLGISGPLLTAVTPALLRATAHRRPGVVIRLPAPTALESYVQFAANLAQLVLLTVIITGAAVVASERRAGTIVLMLTKPLTRTGFVLAKALSSIVLLVAATALGTALCIVVTIGLFGSGHVTAFLGTVAAWLALAIMFVLLMVLLSAWFDRQAPAAGAGIGVFVALFALTGFPLLRDHSPAGLLAANDAILKGRQVALAWPLMTTVVLGGLFLCGAVWVFGRKEL
jgi:ABC-2 type transport system permease protein